MTEESEISRDGMESKLDTVAGAILFISIISGIACLAVSQSDTFEKTVFSTFLIVLGFAGIAEGIIAWAIFKAGADGIRLLKKLNGIPFGGQISGTKETADTNLECTDCHSSVSADSKFCPQCGAKFD